MKLIIEKAAGALLTSLAMLITGSLYGCAENNPLTESLPPPPAGETPDSVGETAQAESSALETEPSALFASFGGKITEISPFYEPDGKTERPGWYFVTAESPEGQKGVIAVTDETFFATDAELSAGASITCFYDANAPMPAIEPPQYNAWVVAVDLPDGMTVKADLFDENLVSSDNMLKLNIADATDIVLRDGSPFDGNPAGKKLVVYYGVSTRSIPAQTTPDKIVVLTP